MNLNKLSSFFTKQLTESGEQIGLKHFKPVRPLGAGDTGRSLFASWVLELKLQIFAPL